MNPERKKVCLAVGLAIILTGLFFEIGASSASAAECEKNQNKFSISGILNPAASLIEGFIRGFGYEVSLAASPDPDFCGSDSVACSGSNPTATISWEAAPSTIVYSGYYEVGGWGSYWYSETCPFCYYLLSVPGVSGIPYTVGGASYTISSGLSNNTTYTWSVQAYYQGLSFTYPYCTSECARGFPSDNPYGSFTTPDCAPASYTLTVSKSGSGSGTVNFNPPNSTYSLPHSETYALISNNDPTAGMLSQSGLTVFAAVTTVDNNVNSNAWHTDRSSAGAWLKMDLGAGNGKNYVKARIYARTASYAGNYSIQYSDDSSTWTNAATGFVPSAAGWNEKSWTSVGSHRYWRFYLTNTPGGGSWLTELEMYAQTSVTLTASPTGGSTFAGWSGEGCSGTGTCAVSMTQNRNVTATFNPSNNPPSANNLQATQPDYCVSGPAAIFAWNFTDSDPGDTQSAYRIQADNNSGFSSPEVDSGKVISSSNSYATPPGQLSYNNTYYWRLMVWDSKDAASSWISGPAFTTPIHAYPSIDFSWTPLNPTVEEDTQFVDQSTVYGGASKSDWSWTFENGTPPSSALQNPLIKFLSSGAKSVTLRVTDSNGFSCPGQKTVNSLLKLPEWKEIPPF